MLCLRWWTQRIAASCSCPDTWRIEWISRAKYGWIQVKRFPILPYPLKRRGMKCFEKNKIMLKSHESVSLSKIPNSANCYIYCSSNSPSQPGIHTFSNSVFRYSSPQLPSRQVTCGQPPSAERCVWGLQHGCWGRNCLLKSICWILRCTVLPSQHHNISRQASPFSPTNTLNSAPPFSEGIRRAFRAHRSSLETNHERQGHSASRRSISRVLHQVVRTPHCHKPFKAHQASTEGSLPRKFFNISWPRMVPVEIHSCFPNQEKLTLPKGILDGAYDILRSSQIPYDHIIKPYHVISYHVIFASQCIVSILSDRTISWDIK